MVGGVEEGVVEEGKGVVGGVVWRLELGDRGGGGVWWLLVGGRRGWCTGGCLASGA